MERKEILKEIKKYFSAKELVDKEVYKRYGENSFRFLDDKLLYILYVLRVKIFKVPIMVNYGSMWQRGLRSNLCQLVKEKKSLYLSPHIMGKAIDCDIKGYTAEQARTKIKENLDLFPFPIRMELNVNWLHIDCVDMDNDKKLTCFNG